MAIDALYQKTIPTLNRSFDIRFDELEFGSVNETLHILDHIEGRSQHQSSMYEIENFNTNAKRYELWLNTPNHWDLVTEQYDGFWKYIHESMQYKAAILADDLNSSTTYEAITCLNDNSIEFAQVKDFTQLKLVRHLNQNTAACLRNNTCGKSKLLFTYELNTTASDGTVTNRYRLWIHQYNPTTQRFDPVRLRDEVAGSPGHYIDVMNPANGFAKTKWTFAWGRGLALLAKDDKIVDWPTNSTDEPTVYVSEREKFVYTLPSTTYRHLYRVDTKQDWLFNTTSVSDDDAPTVVCTNYNEDLIVHFRSTTLLEVVDTLTGACRNVKPQFTLPLPPIGTKLAVSPDREMVVWADAVTSTPEIRVVRLRDGAVIFTHPMNGAVNSVVWTKSNYIYFSTNNVLNRVRVSGRADGFISFVAFDNYTTIGSVAVPYFLDYMEAPGQIIATKNSATSALFQATIDELTGVVTTLGSATNVTKTGVLLNYAFRSAIRRVPGHDNQFLAPSSLATWYMFTWDDTTKTWIGYGPDVVAPLAQDQFSYQSLEWWGDGTITIPLVQNRSTGTAVAWPVVDFKNVVDGNIKFLGTLPSGSWPYIMKLDETHFAYHTREFHQVYQLDLENRSMKLVYNRATPNRGQTIYVGFTDGPYQ